MKKAILLLLIVFTADQLIAQSSAISPKSKSIANNQDTTSVKGGAYKMGRNTRLDQLLGKMKGFEIGDDGTVFHEGKQINLAKINGKDYKGVEIAKIIRRLPASMVQNIEVIDGGPSANLSDGRPGPNLDVLNIIITDDGPFYSPAFPGFRQVRSRNGQIVDIPYENPYNPYNRPMGSDPHNPVDRQIDRAIANMQATTNSMYEIDEYGDHIPHFIIKEWPGPGSKKVTTKKESKDASATQDSKEKPVQP